MHEKHLNWLMLRVNLAAHYSFGWRGGFGILQEIKSEQQ